MLWSFYYDHGQIKTTKNDSGRCFQSQMPRHHGRSPGQIAARHHHQTRKTRCQNRSGNGRARRHFRLSERQGDDCGRHCKSRRSRRRMGHPEVILLDTHVVVWVVLDPSKLSQEAVAAIEKSIKVGNGIAMCGVSLLEIAHLVARGRIQTNSLLETLLEQIESRFVILQLNSQIAARAAQLPVSYPRD